MTGEAHEILVRGTPGNAPAKERRENSDTTRKAASKGMSVPRVCLKVHPVNRVTGQGEMCTERARSYVTRGDRAIQSACSDRKVTDNNGDVISTLLLGCSCTARTRGSSSTSAAAAVAPVHSAQRNVYPTSPTPPPLRPRSLDPAIQEKYKFPQNRRSDRPTGTPSMHFVCWTDLVDTRSYKVKSVIFDHASRNIGDRVCR